MDEHDRRGRSARRPIGKPLTVEEALSAGGVGHREADRSDGHLVVEHHSWRVRWAGDRKGERHGWARPAHQRQRGRRDQTGQDLDRTTGGTANDNTDEVGRGSAPARCGLKRRDRTLLPVRDEPVVVRGLLPRGLPVHPTSIIRLRCGAVCGPRVQPRRPCTTRGPEAAVVPSVRAGRLIPCATRHRRDRRAMTLSGT